MPHYLTSGVQRNAVRTHTCEVVDVLDIALVRTFAICRRIARAHRPREALLDRNAWWFDLPSPISETRKVQSFARVTFD